jgi:hypothetical protein
MKIKKNILILMTLFFSTVVNAQKITKIENGGKLIICDMGNNNYTTNCNTVISNGVAVASIGNNKLAILYSSGKLALYNIDRNNYLSNERILESSGVSGVQMNGEQKIIITYSNNKKTVCDLDKNNYKSNCQNY